MSSTHNLPLVVIVGRPNVGKSALFNQMAGKRIAIVHEESGVTRDRVTAPARWGNHHFTLVDTGGLGVRIKEKQVDVFDGLIRDQVAAILAEAAAVVWVTDCQGGVTPQDEEVAAFLRDSGRPVFLAANKADNDELAETAESDFRRFGFTPVFPVTCAHGRGIDRLLDAVTQVIPQVGPPVAARSALRVAVVGRPNVGKSSLVNRLFGAERVIVSDVPGTTRDAIDVPVVLRQGSEEIPVTFIDTAGLRRRRQVTTVVDFFSMARTEGAIRRADVVLLVLDATDPASAQDRRIAGMITAAWKPCIVLVNKWDMLSGSGVKQRDLVQQVREQMPFMAHAPMQVVCAVSGYNLDGLVERLLMVREQMRVTVPTSVFNQFLQDLMARTPPVSVGGKRFKVLYGTMKGNPPPHFVLFANDRKACATGYLQFLENQIRDAFFPEAGLPIRLDVRERQGRTGDAEGRRQAAAGVQRQRQADFAAKLRHRARQKGWRQK